MTLTRANSQLNKQFRIRITMALINQLHQLMGCWKQQLELNSERMQTDVCRRNATRFTYDRNNLTFFVGLQRDCAADNILYLLVLVSICFSHNIKRQSNALRHNAFTQFTNIMIDVQTTTAIDFIRHDWIERNFVFI